MTALTYGGYNETLAYNVRGQLTNLTATGNGLASVNLQYNFPAAPANDGRITQLEDLVAGEEVNYQYDSLGRLTLAQTTGPQWGQSFTYDGFGNLTAEVATKGTAPTSYHAYDPATNRLLSEDYLYDANGNLTSMPGLGLTYNVENKLTQAVSNLNGTENYGYDPAGLRLWKQGPDGVTHVYYNGQGGKPLADFYLASGSVQGGAPMVYFAGKRVDNGSVEDRLGTGVVEGGQRMAYFPYGEQRSGTASEVQFATYKRDSTTNLDYAAHRYYSSQIGRFTTPDPKASSAKPGIPQSWNRYTYALGDPINGYDPNGAEYLMEDGSAWGMFAAAAFAYASGPTDVGGGNGPVPDPVPDPSDEGDPVAGILPVDFPELPPAADMNTGGGTSTNLGGLNTDPAGTGKTAWQYLTSVWSNCLNDFKQDARFDAAAFQNLLTGGITWLDERNSSVANATVDSYAQNGDTRPLWQLFSTGASAITLPGTSDVAVGANYFTDNTQTEQIAIAIHEALHITLGMDDPELAGWLMNFGFKPSATFSSHEITDWIVGTPDHMSTAGGGCKNP